MAVFTGNFHSDSLGYETMVRVVLPEDMDMGVQGRTKKYKFQTLYLLHGRGDDGTGWTRFTPIERYAREHRLAVVMPTGEDSFYTDSVGGKRYFRYISEELPRKMQQWFPLSKKREDTFIAGLSMGGFGAMKCAFTYPERFCQVGAFSAVTDIRDFSGAVPEVLQDEFTENLQRVYGDHLCINPENDLFSLYQQGKEAGKDMPPLIQYVGTEDFLYDINQTFRNRLLGLGADLTYEEWEGSHEWNFWDRAIQKCLKEFHLKNTVVEIESIA